VARSDRELLREERRKLGKAKPKKRRKIGGLTIWFRSLAVASPIALVALVLAAYFTPILALERIVITGNERLSAQDVRAELTSLMGRPLPTISEAELTGLLADFSLIETFTFRAEPPHTLRVKVRERQPLVVLVRGGENFLYDAAGVQIAPAASVGEYPFLIFYGDPLASPEYRNAVELLLSLPKATYSQVFSVEVSPQLTTKLTLKDGNWSVIWGSNEDSLLKAEVLDSLIATGLEEGVEIDVSSPNSPVVRYPDF
jgi:cell division protein FtsQ